MEQQQLEATNNEDLASGSGADQVDSANPLDKSPKSLSENSEKFHEMAAATESPPKQCFLLDDDGEFPPMNKANKEA